MHVWIKFAAHIQGCKTQPEVGAGRIASREPGENSRQEKVILRRLFKSVTLQCIVAFDCSLAHGARACIPTSAQQREMASDMRCRSGCEAAKQRIHAHQAQIAGLDGRVPVACSRGIAGIGAYPLVHMAPACRCARPGVSQDLADAALVWS